MTPQRKNAMGETRDTHELCDLNEFPPTVVGHDLDESDGVLELYLLDPGTDENPRWMEVWPDGHTEDFL